MTIMNDADKLAAQRALHRRPRTNCVTLNVSLGYVDVDIDLAEIETSDLIDELKQRGEEDALADIDYDQRIEFERIHHLFRVGRREEAADACERMVADKLGMICVGRPS